MSSFDEDVERREGGDSSTLQQRGDNRASAQRITAQDDRTLKKTADQILFPYRSKYCERSKRKEKDPPVVLQGTY